MVFTRKNKGNKGNKRNKGGNPKARVKTTSFIKTVKNGFSRAKRVIRSLFVHNCLPNKSYLANYIEKIFKGDYRLENLFVYPSKTLDTKGDRQQMLLNYESCRSLVNPKLVNSLTNGKGAFVFLLSNRGVSNNNIIGGGHACIGYFLLDEDNNPIIITAGVSTFYGSNNDGTLDGTPLDTVISNTTISLASPDNFAHLGRFSVMACSNFRQVHLENIFTICLYTKMIELVPNKDNNPTYLHTSLTYSFLNTLGYNCKGLVNFLMNDENEIINLLRNPIQTSRILFQSRMICPNQRFIPCTETARMLIVYAFDNDCCNFKTKNDIRNFLSSLIDTDTNKDIEQILEELDNSGYFDDVNDSQKNY